ncbi:MAG: PilT/PilU family type 4a pilus ATPase [Candidatus Omnitrophota bacterium]|nr:PilT/PilU family type 4a pilus ATPase [Candidatus Omnitrophota bacterium]
MSAKQEQRKETRFKFRDTIQYEKIAKDGTCGAPISTSALNIGTHGISFYANEEFELNSKIKITFYISEKEQISFFGHVVRMEIFKEVPMKYVVGAEFENMNEDGRMKINNFLSEINIYNILDRINLENAIDMHLVAGYPPIIKRVGKLEQEGEPLDEYTLRSLLVNILDEERYAKFMRDKDINFVFNYQDKRLRTNIHFQQGKVEGVFRMLPSQIKSPSQLGLPPVVERLLENKKGLLLVAGRTGSGKTTTLASMVEALNNERDGIIICIEDPIEYVHVNKKCIIKQREVGRDTISFASAVKNALRQNPDVLVIGEILDMQTMEIAITASESGTLVLTSIHAPNSSQALDRITSFFPPDLQKHILTRLSLVLKGIITQELLPRSDESNFVPAVEILVVNDALRNIIREGDWKQIATTIQTGRNLGMQSMQDSLEHLVRARIIDNVYLKEYR